MQVNVKIINAFSINNTGGNPAGVVLNSDELTSQQKQAIALKLGLSETAFVSSSAVADFKLDFFTPAKQIAHCGHATIAAFSCMKQTGIVKKNNSSKETIDGIRKINFIGNDAFMEQTAPSYQTVTEFKKEFLKSLNLQNKDLINAFEPIIVNTGNSFFIAGVKSENILQQIKADFEKIEKLSAIFNLIGYYIFTDKTEDSGFDGTARMFAPLYGIDEESATGMAAGPLGCYLHKHGLGKTVLTIQQGKFMQLPSKSLIKVNLTINDGKIIKLFAGGNAYLSDEIVIDI
jgi:PhzF family phenazine biosynthesis protein